MKRANRILAVWCLAFCLVVSRGQTVAQALCDSTSKPLTPLDELVGTYNGYPGGLYFGGSNLPPSSHDSAGKAIALQFVPLDSFGVANSVSGKWVLLSIGMSNATQEFSRFVSNESGDTSLNPYLRIVDGAQGGETAARIKYDTAVFWSVIMSRLAARGLSAKQVQAVWIKEANGGPTGGFPLATTILRNDLLEVIRIAKLKFPNLRQAFLSSRIYAGYASTNLNPEPYAYEGGFAVRWVIEAQINGNDSLNYLPDSGIVKAPWLVWGPYLWGNGVVPRQSDSLQWLCADLQSDGTHPSSSGQQKVALLLEKFFKNSSYTKPWYLKSTGPCCVGVRGNVDCDGSGLVDISDLTRLIDYLYLSFAPLCCIDEANADATGSVDISDLTTLIDHLYLSFAPLGSCP